MYIVNHFMISKPHRWCDCVHVSWVRSMVESILESG